MLQPPTGLHVSGNSLRLAVLIRTGGEFYDKDLRAALGGLHRNSLTYSLKQLRDLNLIDFKDAKLGRVREPRTIVVLESPVWDLINSMTLEVGE